MNKFLSFFLLMSILLSACTPAVIPPTSTPISTSTQQATLTPTIEPTITPSPTPTEIPFVSFAATVDDCTAKQTTQRGYASWEDLLADELAGSTYNPHVKDVWGVPYSMVLVRARVLDVVVVPVTTAYWKAQGVATAHLLCIAFPQSSEAGMALSGFTLADGTYVPMITHLNGGDPTGDGSDDIALPTAASLNQLVNGLYFMRVAIYHGIMQERVMNVWGLITAEKDSDVAYSKTLYIDEIVRRGEIGEKLWVAAWNNPEGYVRDGLGYLIAWHAKHGQGNNFEFEIVIMMEYLAGQYSSDWSTIITRDPVEDGWLLVDKMGTDEFGTTSGPNSYR